MDNKIKRQRKCHEKRGTDLDAQSGVGDGEAVEAVAAGEQTGESLAALGGKGVAREIQQRYAVAQPRQKQPQLAVAQRAPRQHHVREAARALGQTLWRRCERS
jgi:hypothetical protein